MEKKTLSENENFNEDDPFFSVVLIGDISAGKTSICYAMKNAEPCTRDFTPTTGVEYSSKRIAVDERNIKLQIFDTYGHTRVTIMVEKMIQKSTCILLVYDCTQRKTFDDLDYRMKMIQDNAGNDSFTVLVATKIDKTKKIKVSMKEGNKFAQKHEIDFFQVSALTGENIDELFAHIGIRMLQQKRKSHRIGSFKLKRSYHSENYPEFKSKNRKCC